MTILLIFLILALVLALLLRGRCGHPGLDELKGWAYAHRGLHDKPFVPENSMTAFRLAVENGYGAELDVHLLKDGGLAVIHDAALKRTTGADGKVEELSLSDLKNYRLEGTRETIPTLRQVLDLFEEKAPLIIELKPEGGNGAALCEAVCKELDHYKGVYCLESFDPRCVYWLRKNRPDIIRGQLCQNYWKDSAHLGRVMDLVLTNLLGNFLTRPDFIAYRFGDRKNPANQLCLTLWGMPGVSWTIRSQEEFEACMQEDLLPIFENFRPELFPK